jgi:Aminomethyltransferase folate-binding domain
MYGSSPVVYTAMCYEHGGMIDDGTLFRLGENNFRWIGGDDYSGIWLRELAEKLGLKAWVRSSTDQLHNVAVQGPKRPDRVIEESVVVPAAWSRSVSRKSHGASLSTFCGGAASLFRSRFAVQSGLACTTARVIVAAARSRPADANSPDLPRRGLRGTKRPRPFLLGSLSAPRLAILKLRAPLIACVPRAAYSDRQR